MFNLFRKVVFAFVLTLLVVSSGFMPSPTAAYAADGVPEIPLASGLTWNDLGQTERNLQLNIQGDALALPGQTFVASEKFTDGIAPEVLAFYSNGELYKSGWVSDNAWEDEAGTHLVFYHEAGYYLAIDFVKCADDPAASCVTVWESVQKDAGIFTEGQKADSLEVGDAALFIKKTPANNSTGINPLSTFLSWNTYAGTQKYSYCIKEVSACGSTDPNWTGTFLNTSKTLSNLNPNKVYYWQVKAIYDLNTIPKKYVLADGGTVWKFTTSTGSVRISGNAGVSGATLNWVDSYARTATSDSSGNYSFTVRYNWSGTVTPSKTGYTFIPVSRTYTSLTTNQTIQNYLAANGLTISGNAGIAGAVMHYAVSGTAKTVTSNSSGNYVVTVPKNWTGTVTPKKTGYTFTPASYAYTTPLLSSVIGKNYVAKLIRYTIKGDVGIAGAKLTYVDGTTKYVTSDVNGNYTISVPYNWSGKVTPSKTGTSVTFVPAYKTYASVKASIVGQNYRANIRLVLRSNGAYDGHIRELSELSGTGGAFDSTATSFVIGDSALKQQYLAILSFDTSVLPDTANILSAKLKITKTATVGSSPMNTHGSILMGIKTPYFGTGPGLELADFNSSEIGACGTVSKVPSGNVYTGVFTTTGISYIGKTSLTQLRIRFSLDDNNNNIANYVRFASGNATIVANRPVLDIVYYVP